MGDKFLEYLKENHQGRERAVSSNYLQKRLSISSRTIRKIVNQLRNDGIPICSDENGYYYAVDKDEVLNSVNVNIKMCKKWNIIMYKKWLKRLQHPS